MNSTSVTQLKVDDEDFLVASLIDRCPKTMMLRELMQNAIEAAARAPAGQRGIEVDVVEIDGGCKLRIRNAGPGMDEPHLHKMCDIAASIGKVKGLDGNFGMGAKVASLPSNHLGVRYRSCANGLVHEVVIGKRGGLYGRVRRPSNGRISMAGMERLVDILDITEQAREEGYDLSRDWTEVTLLGMRPEHNTAFDPFDGDPVLSRYWLTETLYHRFFRIPDDIEIQIASALIWRTETSRFLTLAQRAHTAFAGYECVTAANGIKLHYFHDPTCPTRSWENTSSEGALQTAMGAVGLVYRNEIYDRSTGSPWAYEAPNYGVTFGARNISVFIELPDDYPVRPDVYRQLLLRADGENNPVTTREFAALVLSARPAWLVEIIDGLGGRSHDSDSIVNDLGKLCARLNLGALADDGGGAEEASSGSPDGRLSKARAACGFDIILLHDEQDINDRWLLGRAACYYKATKQLFVNTQYKSVDAVALELQLALADMETSARLDEIIRLVAIECLVTRVSRALLFAIAKHLESLNWDDGHIEKAMSPESLSIAGDDLYDLLPWATMEVRQRLRANPEAIGIQRNAGWSESSFEKA